MKFLLPLDLFDYFTFGKKLGQVIDLMYVII